MSITTFGTLKTAIAKWLARPDLTDRIVEFVALAEDRIATDLRVADLETSGDLTISAQSVAKPTGFLEARRLYLSTDPVTKLEFMDTNSFWSLYLSSQTGKPKHFTIEGNNFIFGPSPDATYTGKLLYYKRLTALSDDSDTNWLLTSARGLYLYGALIEAQPFIRNDPRIAVWSAFYDNLLDRLTRADQRAQFSGGTLTMRSLVRGP